ncbi:MAG: hypothetical protein JXK94_08615 [Deltaproteobacteria bacterium]|nr:hypothetical protein [Deltaproteobacteria bacterium]
MNIKILTRYFFTTLLIPFAFGLFGCALDLGSTPTATPPSAASDLAGEVYKAKKDVEMYENILKEQEKNRQALQKKIENTSIWDEMKRTVNNAAAVVQMKTDKMIGADQDDLEHMDRRIKATKGHLSDAKRKLKDLEKQQDGGGGGGC